MSTSHLLDSVLRRAGLLILLSALALVDPWATVGLAQQGRPDGSTDQQQADDDDDLHLIDLSQSELRVIQIKVRFSCQICDLR